MSYVDSIEAANVVARHAEAMIREILSSLNEEDLDLADAYSATKYAGLPGLFVRDVIASMRAK